MTGVDTAASIIGGNRTSFQGWILRGFAIVSLMIVVVFASFFAYFAFVVLPRQQAYQVKAKRDAAIFAKLHGAERRLAIYDAFLDRINTHYYDQRFHGVDWKRLRSDWREKAATAKSDIHLYFDVLYQIAQRFPVSHVNVEPPERRNAGDPPLTAVDMPTPISAFCGDSGDTGMQIVPIRRPMVAYIVGEVSPGSPAARAGVVPGWIIQSFAQHPHAKGGQMDAQFLPISSPQMHEFETTGSIKVVALPVASKPAQQMILKPRSVRFSYNCKSKSSGFSAHRLSSGPLYIRFDHFYPAETDKVHEALRTADSRGVILDLRFNDGGYPALLLNAVMGRGQPVYRTRNASGLLEVKTDYSTRRYDGSLAVLVGPASASAAEVSAAVLKHSRRGIVIGRTTNGSVLGAASYPLPDGGSVQVPVEDIEMLDRERLEGRGVVPDVEVYPTIEQISAGRDIAIDRAVHELQKLDPAR